ncbi:hypothetical protein CAOG_002345 [Capsaspora owczarzaki ATCC 30864]|uniref:Uncharacterized protein n=1 Tax=Capsaspora owczarzaki (strain ATCC 30864) TaxID=595528 RepID=A0A0D2X1P5_CAPO3|nr:hypothetical protein CAOG_002345 [Capsaspora owczarzaki ATCC 30864]
MSNAEARKHKRIAKQHVTRRKPLPTTTTPASLPASSEDFPAASPVHSSPSSPSAFAPPAASAPPAPRPASEAPLLRTVLINNSLKLACRQRHELDRREYDQRTLFLQQLSQQRAALLNPGLNTPASNNTNQIICSPMMLLATPPPLPSSDGDCLSNSSSSSSSSSSNNSDSSDNEFDEVASTSDQGNSCPQSPSPLTAMVEEGKTTLASQCLLPQPSLLSSSLTVSGFGAIA